MLQFKKGPKNQSNTRESQGKKNKRNAKLRTNREHREHTRTWNQVQEQEAVDRNSKPTKCEDSPAKQAQDWHPV